MQEFNTFFFMLKSNFNKSMLIPKPENKKLALISLAILVGIVIFGLCANVQVSYADSPDTKSPKLIEDVEIMGSYTWDTPNNAATSNNVYTKVYDVIGEGWSDYAVQIVRADGLIGIVNKAAGNWSESEDYVPYGGPSDLWGENWTAEQINDSDFGVALSAWVSFTGNYSHYLKATDFRFEIPTGATIDGILVQIEKYQNYLYAYVDHIQITVYYTVPGPLDHFALSLASSQSNGSVFSGTNTLTAQDASNATITTFDASANNVTLTSNPADGTITGLGSGVNNVLNQTGDFVDGVADLTSLGMIFTGAAGNHTFIATSAEDLKIGVSDPVKIFVATKLAMKTQPGGGTAGISLTTQPKLYIQDANGDTVITDNSTQVTAAIGTNPGSGTLSGTTTKTAVAGVVTFTNLSIDKLGTGYTLSFTNPALTGTTSAAFNITAGAAATGNWDFTNASDYTYDNSKIDISSGQAQNSHYFKLSVNSTIHNDYGLSYPATYEFSIPAGSSDLKVYRRYTNAQAWTQITEKTSSDFFNGIEAVRFDYADNKAYISVAFDDISDEIHLKITDASDEVISATYSEISTYYDNRDAVVTATADDWGLPDDTPDQAIADAFASRHIWLSPAVMTNYQGTSYPTWANLQNKIDAGYIEPISHSRIHSGALPYADYDSEIDGSKQDLIDNLILPALNTKGAQEYIYGWSEPGGNSDATVRTKLGDYKYLSDRDTSVDTILATWDGVNGVFNRIGASYFSDGGALIVANSRFTSVVSAGGIYHIWGHPVNMQSWLPYHLDGIKEKTNLWYVGFGHLYLYHYIASQDIVSVESINDDDNPTIQPITADYLTFNFLSGFTETASKDGGEIKYQISNDAGSTWYWWDGSNWTATVSGYSEANTASEIDTNISSFPVGVGQFLFKAYLHSDGSQLVQLDAIGLTYINDTIAPTNVGISSITADSASQLTVTATATDLESGVSTYWFNETSGNPGASSSADWQAANTWVDSGLSSNTQYTYQVKAKDMVENISGYSSTSSQYTLPTADTGSNPSSEDSGGSSIDCFIATAAFGTPLAEEVGALRQFRDRYLLTHKIGRQFCSFYYKYSPPLADYIAKSKTARAMVRITLKPLLWFCKAALSNAH